jgi:2,3-bisphosphoglycerate-independent phosphoglycerate mutase
MYKQNITDEFFKPALNNSYKKDEVTIKDNDALIFANFRPDRARELSHLIYGSSCFHYESKCKKCKNLFFVTMTNYEGIKPTSVAFPPITYNNVLGEVISKNKLHQLRIAETEKYAHVTFFFDGGKEINFPFEKKIIIASPKVATYDLLPEMSATKICDEIINNYKKYDLIICNFANCDMVGHTGNMNATIKAVESVDKQITKLYQLAIKNNITLFITADHGNADKMLDEKGVVTTHTTADVPFIIADKNVSLLKSNDNKLADIAPTILNYLNLKVPKEMDGKNLLIKKLNINK